VRKSRRFTQKQPKKFRSYLPAPQIVRIQQRHISGEKNSSIARAEGCDRHTVARIVKSSEMAAFVQQMRERLYGLAPLALDAVEYALNSKDTRSALEVLKAAGVIEPGGYKVPVEQQDERAREEQLKLEWLGVLSCLALERNNVYGTNLPPVLAQVKYPLDLDQLKSLLTTLIKKLESRALSSETDDDE
jgi:hypothetical protein